MKASRAPAYCRAEARGTGRFLLATKLMAVRFVKIAEERVDRTRVTLRLIAGDEGAILGRVSTLAYGASGIEMMSTEGADPPVATALKLAEELATFKEQDVDVVDEGGLWQAEWGTLEGA